MILESRAWAQRRRRIIRGGGCFFRGHIMSISPGPMSQSSATTPAVGLVLLRPPFGDWPPVPPRAWRGAVVHTLHSYSPQFTERKKEAKKERLRPATALFPFSTTTKQQPDISTFVKTGHFNFRLTVRVPGLSR